MDMREQIKERLGDKLLVWQERSERRVYFSIAKKDVVATVRFLFSELGMRFSTASATDKLEGFEILYHFCHDQRGEIYSLRVLLEDKEHPEIEAITPVFPGAEWVEREIWEMFGINFKGHPNLKRLLLAEDWPKDNYPLRQEHGDVP